MKNSSVRNLCFLFLAALIWGTGFVAQSLGMDHIGPFAFNAIRFLVGGAVLLPVIAVFDRRKSPVERAAEKAGRKVLLLGGFCCGLVLCVAGNLQQVGIQYTTVGKTGFITALYVVLVPIFGLLIGKRAGARVWVSVVIAVVGLYLLCMSGSLRLAKGDTFVLLCAVAFAIHILVIDHFSPRVDGVKMSCIQFFVAGILSGVWMLFTEGIPTGQSIVLSWASILYVGVLSTGTAFTLQIVGQKNVNPTLASLVLSLESVFSVLAGWIILHQSLSKRELLGCILMFAAILLAQLPDRKKKETPEKSPAGEKKTG